MNGMEIMLDDLRGPAIAALIREHLQCMAEESPPESVHALDLDGLRQPDVTFWSAWEQGELLGCGALKQLDPCPARSNRCGPHPPTCVKAWPDPFWPISLRRPGNGDTGG